MKYGRAGPDFDEARRELAKFWNRAALALSRLDMDIFQDLPAPYNDLVILAWLEIAKVRQTEGTGPHKAGLFDLAYKLTMKRKELEGQAG